MAVCVMGKENEQRPMNEIRPSRLTVPGPVGGVVCGGHGVNRAIRQQWGTNARVQGLSQDNSPSLPTGPLSLSPPNKA